MADEESPVRTPPYETITRAELAKRLLIAETDLLSRGEAAALIGIGSGTLSNLGSAGPAFYRTTKGPSGGKTWYPRANAESYARWRQSKSASSFNGDLGQLGWPNALAGTQATVPIHRIVEMVERWKRRELYRRAQAILVDPFGSRDEFDDELRMLGAPWGDRASAVAKAIDEGDDLQRREIFKSLDDESRTIQRMLRKLCDEEGVFPTFENPTYHVLISMMRDAWLEAVMAERRWRNLEYSGMPSSKPE